MLLNLFGSAAFIIFLFFWLFDLKSSLRVFEKTIQRERFLDRLNQEKYLEEVGYHGMSDPW